MIKRKTTAYNICSDASNCMKSDNPNSGIYEANTTRTLDTNGGNPSCAQGGTMIVEDKAFCLQGGGGVTSQNSQGSGVNEDVSFTLNSTDRYAVYDPSVHHDYRQFDDVSETVRSRYGTGGNNQRLVVAPEETVAIGNGQLNQIAMSDKANALDTMHDQQAILSYGLDRASYNQGKNAKFDISIEEGPGAVLPKMQGTVRRLTPLECERLQGFPDGWTDVPGASDSKRYKALGNSIALPFWEFLAHRFVRMGEVGSIGSLFDGIGGFPLVFHRAGAETKWTSEIEPFCEAVVKYHIDSGDL